MTTQTVATYTIAYDASLGSNVGWCIYRDGEHVDTLGTGADAGSAADQRQRQWSDRYLRTLARRVLPHGAQIQIER